MSSLAIGCSLCIVSKPSFLAVTTMMTAFKSHLLSLGMGHVDINGYGRRILYCGVHVEQNRSEFAGKK